MKKSLEKEILKIKEKIDKLLKEKNRPIVVGIAGGSGSGKGYITDFFLKNIKGNSISMDDYYIGSENMKDRNFDRPEAIDLELLKKHIKFFKSKKEVEKPVYDFVTHKRRGYESYRSDSNVIIIEGLFALNKILIKEIDLKIFIDSPEKSRLSRRIKRDKEKRKRSKERTIQDWQKIVEPMYKKYAEKQKKYADIILKN